jgi:hypothetical protein
VLTEDKLVLGLNIPLKNIADALRRKLVFKVSGFKLQVHPIFKKELQCVGVNILWGCKECLPNNKDHVWHQM